LILLDTSGLFAALNPDQAQHERAREAVEREERPFVISPFVLAEVDCFLATRGSVEAELAFLDEVAHSAYDLAGFDAGDVSEAHAVIETYLDFGIGLTDASIVVLAGKFGTDRVLTLDERHFRTLRTPDGRPFTILPADA
jgi:predicted nucleic acid-binding protein